MKHTASFYIEQFKLIPHPEGGWYKETYKATEAIEGQSLPERFKGDRSFCTAIYYLLEKGDFSAFHRIKSDEIFHFYAGDALEIIMISPEGRLSTVSLGPNPEKGEIFHFPVPAGFWFAAKLKTESTFAFVGCTVAPGFEFEDFELAERDKLLVEFPEHHRAIIALTR